MSLKGIRRDLERLTPEPQRPLPGLIVSCVDKDHDRTAYVIQINGPRLKFDSVEAARAWLEDAPQRHPDQ